MSPSQSHRPLIGISCYIETARWGPWDGPAALVPYTYIEAIENSGGRALMIPPDPADGHVVDVLDGLVLAGGSDVDPARYGATPHPETTGLRPQRDAGELALLRASRERDVPTLGICRGMQLMAVAYGGSLIQHMPDVFDHHDHRPDVGVYGWHGARFKPDSLVGKTLGENIKVNSYHHQGVADPGGLTVTGWADDDSIEVLEDPSKRFMLGVQWHPETTDDHRLFAAFIDAARQ